MIVKLLGITDMITAIVAVLVHLGVFPVLTLKFFIAYLIVKGIIFIKSFSSVLDLACAIYLVLMIFGVHSFLIWIVAVYLFQKAAFSLAS